MIRKYRNITNKIYPLSFILLLLLAWGLLCFFEIAPPYMLPSPASVARVLVSDFPLLFAHAKTTMIEAVLGLCASVFFGVLIAVVMDRFEILYLAVRPVIILSQTVPAIAIAPLLILWMGFGIAPKVLLVFITCFFPIVISTLSGLRAVDPDIIDLFRSMGASPAQILKMKLKAARESFFAGLRLAAAYAIVGAVIAEWLGGLSGLGVYMTRVRKAYAFDKMFAVILIISGVSLLLMKFVDFLHKKAMPWKGLEK